ncbi:hypothetical protein Q9966_008878 [Columba livia]|nr:hypothetical protein Q9966_008878 [Columba livia]
MVKGKVAEIMQNDRLGGLDVLDAEFSKTWEFKSHNVAVYSIQGRRDHMEDRFEVITDLVNKTHPSIFGIFDGHGGEASAQLENKIKGRWWGRHSKEWMYSHLRVVPTLTGVVVPGHCSLAFEECRMSNNNNNNAKQVEGKVEDLKSSCLSSHRMILAKGFFKVI